MHRGCANELGAATARLRIRENGTSKRRDAVRSFDRSLANHHHRRPPRRAVDREARAFSYGGGEGRRFAVARTQRDPFVDSLRIEPVSVVSVRTERVSPGCEALRERERDARKSVPPMSVVVSDFLGAPSFLPSVHPFVDVARSVARPHSSPFVAVVVAEDEPREVLVSKDRFDVQLAEPFLRDEGLEGRVVDRFRGFHPRIIVVVAAAAQQQVIRRCRRPPVAVGLPPLLLLIPEPDQMDEGVPRGRLEPRSVRRVEAPGQVADELIWRTPPPLDDEEASPVKAVSGEPQVAADARPGHRLRIVAIRRRKQRPDQPVPVGIGEELPVRAGPQADDLPPGGPQAGARLDRRRQSLADEVREDVVVGGTAAPVVVFGGGRRRRRPPRLLVQVEEVHPVAELGADGELEVREHAPVIGRDDVLVVVLPGDSRVIGVREAVLGGIELDDHPIEEFFREPNQTGVVGTSGRRRHQVLLPVLGGQPLEQVPVRDDDPDPEPESRLVIGMVLVPVDLRTAQRLRRSVRELVLVELREVERVGGKLLGGHHDRVVPFQVPPDVPVHDVAEHPRQRVDREVAVRGRPEVRAFVRLVPQEVQPVVLGQTLGVLRKTLLDRRRRGLGGTHVHDHPRAKILLLLLLLLLIPVVVGVIGRSSSRFTAAGAAFPAVERRMFPVAGALADVVTGTVSKLGLVEDRGGGGRDRRRGFGFVVRVVAFVVVRREVVDDDAVAPHPRRRRTVQDRPPTEGQRDEREVQIDLRTASERPSRERRRRRRRRTTVARGRRPRLSRRGRRRVIVIIGGVVSSVPPPSGGRRTARIVVVVAGDLHLLR
eukprot:CAMPEP_0197179392 /NCGR_PEP_ID=MMETSP1423-20130617/4362_1 /TAXON_ID=476441 /ORGANISM="Pseudo-nitzschia heimii, Strain UNC1101" /LENGTH=824 /DNA_ID=CAMNT_0042629301 /DNA_START=100 /DNA_END=2569 /DNA_ORIENTATION=-